MLYTCQDQIQVGESVVKEGVEVLLASSVRSPERPHADVLEHSLHT